MKWASNHNKLVMTQGIVTWDKNRKKNKKQKGIFTYLKLFRGIACKYISVIAFVTFER